MNEIITFREAFLFIANACIVILACGIVLVILWGVIKALCVLAGWLGEFGKRLFEPKGGCDE